MTAQAIPNEVLSTTEWTDICSLYEITGDTGVCALYNNEQVAIFRPRQSDDLYRSQTLIHSAKPTYCLAAY